MLEDRSRSHRSWARRVVQREWRPQRDSNPCFGLERATSWASGRWGPAMRTHDHNRAEECRQPGEDPDHCGFIAWNHRLSTTVIVMDPLPSEIVHDAIDALLAVVAKSAED